MEAYGLSQKLANEKVGGGVDAGVGARVGACVDMTVSALSFHCPAVDESRYAMQKKTIENTCRPIVVALASGCQLRSRRPSVRYMQRLNLAGMSGPVQVYVVGGHGGGNLLWKKVTSPPQWRDST